MAEGEVENCQKLTIETASLGSVGVEEAERDDDDEEEAGDHHGYHSGHGNRFCFYCTHQECSSGLDPLLRFM